MTRRKKRSVGDTSMLPFFLFTQETLQLTGRALALFEERLLKRSQEDERVQLAGQTLLALKQKVAAVHPVSGSKSLTAFNCNEVVILATSLQLLLLELTFSPHSLERSNHIRQCQKLLSHFQSLLTK